MNTSANTVITEPTSVDSSAFRRVLELTGRILLAAMFLISGIGKIGSYAATAGYMSSAGVPGALLPLVIATEIAGAVCVVIGWKTRLAAFLLAGFTLLTAAVFHHNFADQTQAIMFLKNVSIAGGLLVLAANGAGPLSIDRRAGR